MFEAHKEMMWWARGHSPWDLAGTKTRNCRDFLETISELSEFF